MILSSRHLLVSLLACGSVAGIVIACGSETSTFDDGKNNPPVFSDGGFPDPSLVDPSASLYKDDPPPQWCGPESGAKAPPTITGTAECPSDKNLPGCACDTIGATAPCWEGLRKDRNLGICKDGTTTCIRRSETLNVWDSCKGQVLPVPGGKGAEACNCFTAGEWKIKNTSPCLWTNDDVNYTAFSTQGDTGAGCTSSTPPGGPWSSSTLKVDCEGTFRLCFKIRAGDYNNPKSDDCVLGEACVNATYLNKGEIQKLAEDLPAWVTTNPTCARKWEKETPSNVSPGYGEMIVKGKSFYCDDIDDGSGNPFVFNRVQYCPRICRPTNPVSDGGYHPEAQICIDCQLSAEGRF
jgi:hypothetical protein